MLEDHIATILNLPSSFIVINAGMLLVRVFVRPHAEFADVVTANKTERTRAITEVSDSSN